MTQEQVNAAFDALLLTITGAGDIHVDDGTIYYPQQGVPYLVGKLSAYQNNPIGSGMTCTRSVTGSYTISVRRPASEGRSTAGNVAGQIAAMFGRGICLAVGTSQSVQIINSSEQQVMLQGDWITIPVVASFLGSDP